MLLPGKSKKRSIELPETVPENAFQEQPDHQDSLEPKVTTPNGVGGQTTDCQGQTNGSSSKEVRVTMKYLIQWIRATLITERSELFADQTTM